MLFQLADFFNLVYVSLLVDTYMEQYGKTYLVPIKGAYLYILVIIISKISEFNRMLDSVCCRKTKTLKKIKRNRKCREKYSNMSVVKLFGLYKNNILFINYFALLFL